MEGYVPLLTTAELAQVLGRAGSTIEKDRVLGRLGIPLVRIGRMVRYRRSDVDAWINTRVVQSTSQKT